MRRRRRRRKRGSLVCAFCAKEDCRGASQCRNGRPRLPGPGIGCFAALTDSLTMLFSTRCHQGPARGELPQGSEWKQVSVASRYAPDKTLEYMQVSPDSSKGHRPLLLEGSLLRPASFPPDPGPSLFLLPFCPSAHPIVQAFRPDGRRLCLHCLSLVPGCEASGPSEVLPGPSALFCSSECEGDWRVATSPAAARRALFRLEKGVCQECGLDCEALLRRLQVR